MKKWWENNKDTHNTRVKRWQNNNAQKVRHNARKWAAANPEKVKLKSATYRSKNKAKVTAWAVTAQARRQKRVPSWLTQNDFLEIRAIYAMSRQLSQVTGTIWEVDHVVPLQGKNVSGLHVPVNLQIVPKSVNRNKRNLFLA